MCVSEGLRIVGDVAWALHPVDDDLLRPRIDVDSPVDVLGDHRGDSRHIADQYWRLHTQPADAWEREIVYGGQA
jgi:hypothetical protein